MPATRRVFIVVQQHWCYNDEGYDGDDTPVKAFTDRDQAEAYLARCRERDRARSLVHWGEGSSEYVIVPMDVPA
jgi:hypothetical protein